MKFQLIKYATCILLLAPLAVRGIEIQESVGTTKQTNTATDTRAQSNTLLAQLQFHLLELKNIHANQARDTTRIKTETSWVRKLITDLQNFVSTRPENNVASTILANMLTEVERDDMLDLIETNLLLVQYTQLEKMLTNASNPATSKDPAK